jgi:hypothetical protein
MTGTYRPLSRETFPLDVLEYKLYGQSLVLLSVKGRLGLVGQGRGRPLWTVTGATVSKGMLGLGGAGEGKT